LEIINYSQNTTLENISPLQTQDNIKLIDQIQKLHLYRCISFYLKIVLPFNIVMLIGFQQNLIKPNQRIIEVS